MLVRFLCFFRRAKIRWSIICVSVKVVIRGGLPHFYGYRPLTVVTGGKRTH